MTKSAIGFTALVIVALTGTTALAADDGGPGSPSQGRRFALQTCSVCHVVARGQISPRRFATAPSFAAIARANTTTPSGLRVFLSNPHPSMPNLVLTRDEQRDVIAYIMSLKR